MFSLKPKKNNEFFELFIESAQYFYQGTLLMDEVMMDHRKADIKVKEINEIEHKADKINDAIIDKLNQTFITPIDREDIYAIANGLDDGVDRLQGTLQRIVIYNTGEAREGAIRLTKILIESTAELVKAVGKKAEEAKVAIRNIRRDGNDSIKKLEKSKDITEDESKKGQEDMQKLVDKYIKLVDSLKEDKDKEIMEI